MKETLIQLLRRQPFRPFAVQMSNGETFEVRHPEMAALLKSNIIISKSDSDEFEICSLLHVANVKADGSIAPSE
jgi:hypothetical protein